MANLELSGRILGGFLVREPIGVGGQGVVYRCEQRELGRDAAIKVLLAKPGDHADAERFQRSAQLTAQLEHPFAAHVYAFGVEDDGLQWIAMEFVRGVTLGTYLKERGPIPLVEFVPFFEQIAEVVHAAHARGIVHRDLKPSNVMVIESGGRLSPKLLDFGISKTVGAVGGADEEAHDDGGPDRTAISIRLTPSGVLLGSMPYMSPEQWRDPHGVSPATDIYALGCLAYEVLTGRTPFVATSARGYRDCHLLDEAPSLGEGFPPGADQAIRRALSKAPAARQETAIELTAELRAALRTEPREQLRSAAQLWADRARSPDILWASQNLSAVARAVPSKAMSELECSFVAASHRRGRRRAWGRRALVAVAAGSALLAFAGHAAMQARLAETEARAARELAEARINESELEQGRAALLHSEPEAQRHLAAAYKREPAVATAFMLARAMQPRLSERARLQGTYGHMWWATFSPDGSQIATADDRAAQLWDSQTHRLLFTLPHGAAVYQTVYAPDGAWLVTVTGAPGQAWPKRKGGSA
jgi:serine/threonine protein kinase